MRVKYFGSIFCLLLLLLSIMNVSAQPQTQPFLIIVNSKNTMSSVDRKFLSDVFLKKVTRWNNDDVVRPVDLLPKSSTRQKFSDMILKRSVSEVKNYWQQRIFAGYDVPPAELSLDSDVIKFVANTPGAIGYVSSEADISGVKILIVN